MITLTTDAENFESVGEQEKNYRVQWEREETKKKNSAYVRAAAPTVSNVNYNPISFYSSLCKSCR